MIYSTPNAHSMERSERPSTRRTLQYAKTGQKRFERLQGKAYQVVYARMNKRIGISLSRSMSESSPYLVGIGIWKSEWGRRRTYVFHDGVIYVVSVSSRHEAGTLVTGFIKSNSWILT